MNSGVIPNGRGDERRPLISFVLLAYNQERFLRRSIEGAFLQDYSPLEIILSDDSSSDRSFEIMREMTEAYSGPHTVILNRNDRNLGIGAHLNRVMELARGELVVVAAGDDISLPQRTSTLYHAWCASGGKAFSLFSDAFLIDEEDRRIGILHGETGPGIADSPESALRKGGVGVSGCTHMFSRETYDRFGPIDPCVMAEDMAIPFRSLILGEICYVDEQLVMYRVHSANVSFRTTVRPALERRTRDAFNHMAVLGSWLRDVNVASSGRMIDPQRADRLRSEIIMKLVSADFERQFYQSSFPSGFMLASRFMTRCFSWMMKVVEKRMRSS